MLIIAHRGASGEFPENSLLAFEQAIIQKADGIELDVQQHPDGELLLLHDRFITLDNGNKVHFSQLSIEQIKNGPQPVVTLEQALSCIAGQCLVNIEFKCMSDCETEIKTLLNKTKKIIERAVSKNGFTEQQFIISSFNHLLLEMCEELLPFIKKSALIACNPLLLEKSHKRLSLTSINPTIECINRNFVKRVHQLGIQVWVYTVDQPCDIEKCVQYGVNAIFTNFPAKTREYLSKIYECE